ncbi:MAG TPA: PucR family transcriptional regulator ligand-binding domain-containing protein [bacterium]|nr:PucR family transcriptional regulator ligand-binding domain-containing protein [bacterium]
MLTVKEALELDVLRDVKIVAGSEGLDRQIRWCHIIDNPEIVRWIQGGELLLTTGYGWPEMEQTSRRTIRALNGKRLAAILFDPGPFLGEIPANVVDEAGRLELPVLVAPRKLRFADVTEAVGRELIRRQYAIIERADRYHRQITAAAVEARDLNDIARTVCGLTRRSVAIEDAEFRPLARADSPATMKLQRAEHGDGAGTPSAAAGPAAGVPPFPHDGPEWRALRERLRGADGAVRQDGRVACAIRAGSELLGYLWILEGQAPLGDLELRVAEHGSMVAALHILRQRSQAAVEARIGHTVVDALIRGDVPAEDLIERSRLLGFDPDGDYVVMMVSLMDRAARGRKWPLTSRDEYDRREHAAQVLRRLLGQDRLPILCTYSLNRIICLLSVNRMPDAPEWPRRFARRLHEHLAGADGVPPVLVTFGTAHAGLAGVSKGYWEADRALALAKDADRILFFEDLTLAHLLAQISDTTSLQAMYARTLGPVLAGPRGRVLRETLWALVDAGFNRETAAAALGIHRNTMRGRLERVQALLCRPLGDPTVRRDLAVIKEIEQLLVPESRPTI